MDRSTPSQAQIDAILQQWQERLRLRDWKIEVCFCDRRDIPDCCLGEIVPHIYAREARIRLASPGEATSDDAAMRRDWETRLVHEMIHLYWTEYRHMDGDEAKELVEERVCNDLSVALVTLSRQQESPRKSFVWSSLEERCACFIRRLYRQRVSLPWELFEEMMKLNQALGEFPAPTGDSHAED